ncbi:acetaldehyde dehydrogenase (acetylating) [Mycolicibacterium aichiense]|uniref:Acetaldehyde dehydrogenase n=1 Tax=Mycolicibacterium aichiense TaxID=1799 RepID=A0AAD1HL53_9MYCO|nr:acetaldehyde dehydrogenase (acetylating) [Mycolicibacterium aichiense]MCV7018649.1 acetaldehyde dehydrogenase (acetylating) [Mycolicibacterium aichiense]BBX07408.1 acetaldehyde dehydrogenase [Mycolicibacterium aichiense]STZ81223.1 acetaldehyde dehydrogenase [Mycolicibacterium aichiense]
MTRRKAAIIGSGNIGTDLMIKLQRRSGLLDVAAMAGIDSGSDGLARAAACGVAVTADGVDGLLALDVFDELAVVFDATSAAAHLANDAKLESSGVPVVDLTPAAVGPFVVPAVNLSEFAGRRNVNMVTCGGQATIPIVAALSRVTEVHYAEIVASIASRSAGPGTRANIDEFTVTTARAIETAGGAGRGKAIIVLNPAEPPMIMRDTVAALVSPADAAVIADAVADMVHAVRQYVPGYRLKQQVRVAPVPAGDTRRRLVDAAARDGDLLHVTVFLEVEGAADYLPAYAGNLDIMTSAAVRVGERLALQASTLQESGR